jgi:hypothetical protein
MNTIRLAWVALLLLGSTVATAGTAFTVAVTLSKGAVASSDGCKAQASKTSAAADGLLVTVDGKFKTDLVLSVDSGGAPVVLKAGATQAEFPAGAYANNRLLVMTGGKKVCELILASSSVDAGVPGCASGASLASNTPDGTSFVTLDRQAREFLDSKHIADHQISKDSNFGRTIRVYHLPSGVPAFPLPRHINEKDDVELWTVLPEGATAKVEVSACDKVPANRVAGSYQAPPGTKESGETDKGTTPVQFRLEGYAHKLNCAGTLTYKLDISHQGAAASTTTSIAFDPVYRFEWGLGYMFDFGRPRQLSLGDRPTADGTGSEKFLIESKDYSGAKPIIALGVNVCGTNPSEMTWCDRLLNPTLLLDPSRLTSGFGAGLMLRPFSGLGLLAGMTVFKTTVLADGIETKVGDRWSIVGDPPTKDIFNRDSLGFVLAVVVSTEVFAGLSKNPE